MPQKKSGHVTLLDVAQASGFSVSTVSIVLSDAPLARRVSEKTREHIRSKARLLGYHPDAHARSLRRRSTQTIGVLAFDLSDPYCIPIMRGIQQGLQSEDYLPLVMDAQTQRKLFDQYLTLLLERRVEGVIVIASWVFEETNLLADIRKNNVPVIIVGRDLTSRGIPSILVDNEAGGSLAMHHLRSLGHRDIAVIRGPQEMCDSEPRWAGIQKVTARSGAAFDPKLVKQLPGLADVESGFHDACRMIKEMLASSTPFTAVLAFDDLTALGVLRGLRQANLRVPQDCSVMGFDDVLPAQVSTPAITTIRQPLHAMGMHAATHMLQILRDREKVSSTKAFLHKARPELIVRESTQRLRNRKERVV